jgi:xanthine dehydrogenase small subunit
LDALRDDPPLVYRDPHSGQRFIAPRTVQALAQAREAMPAAQLLAGGTDVGLWVTKQFRALGDILYLGAVAQLREVHATADELYIGAGASLEQAWTALALRHPELTEVWLRFAAPPLRNAGTMGGNVANGSPIGDSAPVLLALDAQIELRRGERVRRLPLCEFYVDYMKNRLEPGEFVQGLAVPATPARRQVRAYKISKRFDCDISAVCAGLSIELDHGVVASVRLAFGGLAATVRRAAQAEACLLGQVWDSAHLALAQAALAQDFQPLSDMRASSAYRLQVAQNLLRRFWYETRAEDPLPISATSVWSVMPHTLASTLPPTLPEGVL